VVWACREKTCRFYGMESKSIDGGEITWGRGRPRKIIKKTIKKDLEINELDKNMVYDRTLWHRLIHVADPT